MTAKHKLNALHLYGALALAALGGGLTASWAVFWLTLAVPLVVGYYAGDLRR